MDKAKKPQPSPGPLSGPHATACSSAQQACPTGSSQLPEEIAAHMEAKQPAAPSPPQPPPPWPPLREELRLSPGPTTEYGAPTWTLHDPAAHRFYRIGWLEFEVLSRWHLRSVEAVRRALFTETTLRPAEGSIQAVVDFALRNNLLQAVSPADTARLLQMRQMGKTSLRHKILHGYLFMRIPLVAPDRWLASALPAVRWMFSKNFLIALVCFALLGVYLVTREWAAFFVHLRNLWSWQHSIMVILSLGIAKTVHELGHAFAAKHLGLRVPRMGIALMCFMPVLWTDVTESWKLPKRSHRLLIDLSGIGAELLLATIASLLWPLLPPGDMKSAMLTLAGVTWLTTLAVNANPFMRYDGYYILSDLWEMPGLQQRSFALARWHLREMLFGFADPPPEAMPPLTRRKLILYAYGTWLYRFFLFLGISLMVYHLFFKALGFALMMVELIWFLGLPIYKEIAHWHSRRNAIRLNPRTLRFALAALALAILFIIPWHTSVEGAGILSAAHSAPLYTSQPARVAAVHAQPGHAVNAGDILLVLVSPDLDARLTLNRQKLANARAALSSASLDAELRFSYSSTARELQSLSLELAALEEEEKRLTFYAPFSGIFHDLPAWVTPGSWLPANARLGIVVEDGTQLTAYVAENETERLHSGARGRFYPASGMFSPLDVRIVSIEHGAVRDLTHPELPSTVPGGIIPARRTADGRNVPEQALYKVICQVESGPVPPQALTGRVAFEGTRRSFAARLWQAALGVLIRESGLE